MSCVSFQLLIVKQGIKLQTRHRRDIPNYQNNIDTSSNDSLRQGQEGHEKLYPDAKRRTLPSNSYNCHGLTFASRRAWVDSTNDMSVNDILDDDIYKKVEMEDVLPGDIAIYINELGATDHSGIVVVKPTTDTLNRPVIVSKWGRLSEMIHRDYDCPFNATNIKYYRCLA